MLEVINGLRSRQKELPSKLFYDERGSHLFDRITELDEYYPTRTETAIMRDNGDEIAASIGPNRTLIEFGSGSSQKTRVLLEHLNDAQAYVPIDISKKHLLDSAQSIAREFPELTVVPICADYEQELLPASFPRHTGTRTIFFPGSTIGNFHPADAQNLLSRMIEIGGEGSSLLIGVDLKKDPEILHAAYNDKEGVTAAFNINILLRLNRELSADFDIERFRHRAVYNEKAGRVEMHLVSTAEQSVHIAGEVVKFEEGESIWTESSYKYTIDEFSAIGLKAGYELDQYWVDEDDLFSVQLFSVAA